ncbi:MAG: D-2-hydroxyacid dehydrogenase [Spirochaetes bacterium]|nr:D-2-hydroxyacid dehydrogenase [Spirochaetota bacterium]
MDNVLVLLETNPAFRDELAGILSGYNIIFNESGDTKSIAKEVAENTTIILGSPSPAFLKFCPRLKWLQLQSAGANKFTGGELTAGGAKEPLLTCATGSYEHAVSEHMVALTLALFKKLHLYRDEQLQSRWQERGGVQSVQGAEVLVVGLGDIGGGYARRMKALGARVTGVRRAAVRTKPDYVDELILSDALDGALPKADVVALVLPETQETIDLMNRERLAKMKKGAFIVNAGRGSAIDSEALCDALASGALGGAGLDVTHVEPLPPEHRLWKLENALITPHIAGGNYMPQTHLYILRLCLENAARFVKGQRLKSLVDLNTGYAFPQD